MSVERIPGRYVVSNYDIDNEYEIIDRIEKIAVIFSFSPAICFDTDFDTIARQSKEMLNNKYGTFKVITMTIYMTPISFSIGLLFYAISIFKYDFLNVTPIALDLVVNTISDGYIVLDDENIIINR